MTPEQQTLRSRIADIAEQAYQAQDFRTVIGALNTPRHDIVDRSPGGYERVAGVLSRTEMAAVLKVLEDAARSDHADAGLIAMAVRRFSAGQLDFSSTVWQDIAAELPILSSARLPQDVADRLRSIGIRTESDADQINGGVPFTTADIQGVWNAEQATTVKQRLADYLASKVQTVQNGIDGGTITNEAGVDAALMGVDPATMGGR